MFFFGSPPQKTEIIKALKALPDQLSLADFTQQLPATLLAINTEIIEFPVEEDLISEITTGLDDSADNDPLRKVRHIIYSNPSIKEKISKDGRDLSLNYYNYLQVVLAKRILPFRLNTHFRNEILKRDTSALEHLVVTQKDHLRSVLHAEQSNKNPYQARPAQFEARQSTAITSQRVRSIHRLRIPGGLHLEWDADRPLKKKSSTALETIFNNLAAEIYDISASNSDLETLTRDYLAALQKLTANKDNPQSDFPTSEDNSNQ
jgi:hypothetical protein